MRFFHFPLLIVCGIASIGTQMAQAGKLELKPQLPIAADDNHAAAKETLEQRNERMKWWRDAKFGLFIHYGLYSGLAGEWKGKPGGSEWIQKNVEVDTKSYREEALPLFNPAPKAVEKWVQLAKDVGCQYAVLTTKHHDGFCLFDNPHTDYDTKDHFNRDLVGEFAQACKKVGLKLGFYHSVIDWQHPDYDHTICPDLCYPKGQIEYLQKQNIPRNHQAYQTYLHSSIKELMSKYGTVDILWWDYSQGDMEGKKGWEAPKLIEMIKDINPQIIMNNRLYSYSGLNQEQSGSLDLRCGDFITPEKFIPAEGYPSDWESCITTSDKWGYNRYDTKVKSSEELVGKLVECITKGGNLLLNINPKADGSISEAVEQSIRGLGKWVNTHKEAIFNTRAYLGLSLPATQNEQGDIFIFCDQDSLFHLPQDKSKALRLDTKEPLKINNGTLQITPQKGQILVIKLS